MFASTQRSALASMSGGLYYRASAGLRRRRTKKSRRSPAGRLPGIGALASGAGSAGAQAAVRCAAGAAAHGAAGAVRASAGRAAAAVRQALRALAVFLARDGAVTVPV